MDSSLLSKIAEANMLAWESDKKLIFSLKPSFSKLAENKKIIEVVDCETGKQGSLTKKYFLKMLNKLQKGILSALPVPCSPTKIGECQIILKPALYELEVKSTLFFISEHAKGSLDIYIECPQATRNKFRNSLSESIGNSFEFKITLSNIQIPVETSFAHFHLSYILLDSNKKLQQHETKIFSNTEKKFIHTFYHFYPCLTASVVNYFYENSLVIQLYGHEINTNIEIHPSKQSRKRFIQQNELDNKENIKYITNLPNLESSLNKPSDRPSRLTTQCTSSSKNVKENLFPKISEFKIPPDINCNTRDKQC